jgi:integrase/recombinase XerD
MSRANLSKSRFKHQLDRNEKVRHVRKAPKVLTVKVWQRGKQKAISKGETNPLAIYLELQYGKNKKATSTGIFVRPDQLDTEKMRIVADAENDILLQTYVAKAQQFYTELKITERPVDLALIMAATFDYATLSTPTLFNLFDLYVEQCQQRCKVGDMAAPTVRKIKVWHNRIKAFIIKRYGKNAPISSVVPNDSTAFVLFLKSEFEYSHNSTQMAVSHFKRVLNFAIENEWLMRNPFINLRRKFEDKKIEFLNESEIEKLENLNLLDERLRRVNDVFLFLIYTGLSFSDLQSLRKHHIHELGSGELYIFKERNKTKKTQTLYLNKKALAILAKYEDDNYCNQYGFLVPILSNQKINANLKAIQAIAGMDKRLTCHLARRTFATVVYEAGVDEKTLRAVMGHSSIAMTLKHYAKVSQKSVVHGLKNSMKNSPFGT